MKNNRRTAFLPVLFLFVALNSFFFAGGNMLARWNADQEVLIIGNTLLFVVTLISFMLAKRGLNHPNPNAFFRAVYGSILIKLFVCMIAALVYIALYKKELNKFALFTCMGLYLVYTFLEVSILTKLLRKQPKG